MMDPKNETEGTFKTRRASDDNGLIHHFFCGKKPRPSSLKFQPLEKNVSSST